MKVLDTDFAQSFIRMCNDGWMFGWHESNGGNASYRLRPEEVSEVRTGFRTRPWVHIDTEVPILAGEFFLITAAGSHFRSIAHDPKSTLGIIEIDRTGTCWRECWGFKDGAHPTSELVSHLINHEVRKAATQGDDRVIYHCHPANLAAMTCVVPHDSAVFTRTLWAQLAECALVCREGVDVISWEVPGSVDLAIESAKAMEHTGIVVWPHHGLFIAAATMDEAFGIAHTVEKSAEIFCKARACGMASVSQITDEELVSFSREYGLELSRRNVYAKPCLGAHSAPAHAAKDHAHGHPAHAAVTHIPGTFRFPSPEDEPTPAPSDSVASPGQGVPSQVVGEVSSQVIPSTGAPGDLPLHVPSLPKLPGPELSPEEQEKLPSMLPRLDQVAPQSEGMAAPAASAVALPQMPIQADAAADGLSAGAAFAETAHTAAPASTQQFSPSPCADAPQPSSSEDFPPPSAEALYPSPFPGQAPFGEPMPSQGQPPFVEQASWPASGASEEQAPFQGQAAVDELVTVEELTAPGEMVVPGERASIEGGAVAEEYPPPFGEQPQQMGNHAVPSMQMEPAPAWFAPEGQQAFLAESQSEQAGVAAQAPSEQMPHPTQFLSEQPASPLWGQLEQTPHLMQGQPAHPASPMQFSPEQSMFMTSPQQEAFRSPAPAEPEQAVVAAQAQSEQLVSQEADEVVRHFYPKPPKHKA